MSSHRSISVTQPTLQTRRHGVVGLQQGPHPIPTRTSLNVTHKSTRWLLKQVHPAKHPDHRAEGEAEAATARVNQARDVRCRHVTDRLRSQMVKKLIVGQPVGQDKIVFYQSLLKRRSRVSLCIPSSLWPASGREERIKPVLAQRS
jgi:hypothetical protein